MCGEAASNPRCVYLFTAIETDKLSMNPASIPVIKDLIRKVRLTDTKKALNRVLLMEDSREITSYFDKILPSTIRNVDEITSPSRRIALGQICSIANLKS
ncbi:MAG: hypothetical protein HF982_04225 [Desulfobacteraceae bacterium]|nr:hypothetical protein [Desulfobacteraceae bacterium]MBC2718790.1 hypothetical protein [Desulfobacteraceae bacterium]